MTERQMRTAERAIRRAIERGMSFELDGYENGRQPHDRDLKRPYQRALRALNRMMEELSNAD